MLVKGCCGLIRAGRRWRGRIGGFGDCMIVGGFVVAGNIGPLGPGHAGMGMIMGVSIWAGSGVIRMCLIG